MNLEEKWFKFGQKVLTLPLISDSYGFLALTRLDSLLGDEMILTLAPLTL